MLVPVVFIGVMAVRMLNSFMCMLMRVIALNFFIVYVIMVPVIMCMPVIMGYGAMNMFVAVQFRNHKVCCRNHN